jgi:hypothetical protein
MTGGQLPSPGFFEQVRDILRQARHRAQTSVNFIMVEAYWQVGRRIVEEEQGGEARADYGRFLIRELSRRLGDEFGKGFSVANLWNFGQFYLAFPDDEKLYALRRELSWSHYRLIMRIEQPRARDFYIQEAAEQHWSSRQLERNIRSGWYERLLSAPDGAATAEQATATPAEFVKDPYVLEFLGQMDMYVRMFDDLKRGEDDNPTLGIILCADKDDTLVRYSVLHDSEQLFASKYLRVLPSEEELKRELEARHVLDRPAQAPEQEE